jgi:hypothetical protein
MIICEIVLIVLTLVLFALTVYTISDGIDYLCCEPVLVVVCFILAVVLFVGIFHYNAFLSEQYVCEQEPERFILVYQNGDYSYLQEVSTGLMYFKHVSHASDQASLMLDPQSGLPLTYLRFFELYQGGIYE